MVSGISWKSSPLLTELSPIFLEKKEGWGGVCWVVCLAVMGIESWDGFDQDTHFKHIWSCKINEKVKMHFEYLWKWQIFSATELLWDCLIHKLTILLERLFEEPWTDCDCWSIPCAEQWGRQRKEGARALSLFRSFCSAFIPWDHLPWNTHSSSCPDWLQSTPPPVITCHSQICWGPSVCSTKVWQWCSAWIQACDLTAGCGSRTRSHLCVLSL